MAFLVLLAVGFPVWKLTGTSAILVSPVSKPVEEPLAKVRVEFSYTTVPSDLSVLHLGKEIWRGVPQPGVGYMLSLPYPKEGIDLEFHLEWPTQSVSALRVELRDPQGRQYQKSLWGSGHVEEVLTFP